MAKGTQPKLLDYELIHDFVPGKVKNYITKPRKMYL